MDRVEIEGVVTATTEKGILVLGVDFETWFPRSHCEVIDGCVEDGCEVVLSVPMWIIYKKRDTAAEEEAEAEQANAQKDVSDNDSEGFIPHDMLKRLIYLCHPDKHGESKVSHIAIDWLLAKRDSDNRKYH